MLIIHVQPGSVEVETKITFAPLADELTSRPGFRLGGFGFSLTAQHDVVVVESFSFAQPVRLEIVYADADIAGLDEESLALKFWDAALEVWSSEGISLLERDAGANKLVYELTHLTSFGLGAVEWQLHLPVVTN